eukprot:scaffold1966_cov118-Isochrysis_galbana.AAC.3
MTCPGRSRRWRRAGPRAQAPSAVSRAAAGPKKPAKRQESPAGCVWAWRPQPKGPARRSARGPPSSVSQTGAHSVSRRRRRPPLQLTSGRPVAVLGRLQLARGTRPNASAERSPAHRVERLRSRRVLTTRRTRDAEARSTVSAEGACGGSGSRQLGCRPPPGTADGAARRECSPVLPSVLWLQAVSPHEPRVNLGVPLGLVYLRRLRSRIARLFTDAYHDLLLLELLHLHRHPGQNLSHQLAAERPAASRRRASSAWARCLPWKAARAPTDNRAPTAASGAGGPTRRAKRAPGGSAEPRAAGPPGRCRPPCPGPPPSPPPRPPPRPPALPPPRPPPLAGPRGGAAPRAQPPTLTRRGRRDCPRPPRPLLGPAAHSRTAAPWRRAVAKPPQPARHPPQPPRPPERLGSVAGLGSRHRRAGE